MITAPILISASLLYVHRSFGPGLLSEHKSSSLGSLYYLVYFFVVT